MMKRILDFATQPARLRVRNKQLIISHNKLESSVPLEEAAIVVISQGQVTFSNAVLTGIAGSGGILVTCDSHFQPVGMLLPITGNKIQVERFGKQANLKTPLKKRLWQTIIKAKVRNQAAALQQLHGDSFGLERMVDRILSGDPKNIEAQAARRYWGQLFGDPSFRRNRDLPGLNSILNYGYAVLRAIIARSICASGLHPSIGLHHHNRYSMFPLADDLMEPFRPIVDLEIANHLSDLAESETLTPEIKKAILEVLLARYQCQDESRTLFDIANRLTASLVNAIDSGQIHLQTPEMWNQHGTIRV